MTDNELPSKLAKIGYSTLWLDYGVLTIDQLIEQVKIFGKSNDHNTEHFRYQTFRHYLSSKRELSDKEFDIYLRLTFTDPDPVMAGSATVDIFDKIDLTNLQFQKLCKTVGHFGEWTEKVVTRQILLRQLRTSKLTDELFKDCIENGDSIIHYFIIDIADINQLQGLVIKGRNNKIRKMALEKLTRLTQQLNNH